MIGCGTLWVVVDARGEGQAAGSESERGRQRRQQAHTLVYGSL